MITAYLIVHGFMGLSSRTFKFGASSSTDNYESYLYLGIGLGVFVYLFTYLINSAFSGSYISQYVENKNNFTSKMIWDRVMHNIGSLALMIFIGIAFMIGYFIISGLLTVALSFIHPYVPFFFTLILQFLIKIFLGLIFVAIFDNNNGIGKGMSNAWELFIHNFLFVLGYSFSLSMLNLIITTLILMIPGTLFGIYVFFSIENNTVLYTSPTANVLFTLFFCLYIIVYTGLQALNQLAFGTLYYNLHEKKFNTHLQSRIELIGQTTE
ncbi:hypothetical protein NBRC110019_06670 [Neptunitalea chrysea]|uniref:Uncharacterized protein n=2 Tax=Neptunitalea chrysea TaxID=1647581 RepID=A0A9W6B6I9_9FLAO|nr:hypothetical protein NBRC110019_06670 [Neptunitalea chrysea]